MRRRSNPRPYPRRGVLLLIVLSFLVLFVLVAITFVIVAGQYRRNTAASAKIGREADDANLLLKDAFIQAVRGSTNTLSAVYPHSLLEHMYGNNDLVKGTIATGGVNPNGVIAGGQFVELAVNMPTSASPQCLIAGYYNGCVLTILSSAMIRSTRIVGYQPGSSPTTATVRVMPFQQDGDMRLPNVGDTFLINGRPFNGAGIGYNASSGKLDLPNPAIASPTVPYALTINFATAPTLLSTNSPFYGDVDVDYTAADIGNPLLAAPGATPGSILPSLHRPELVQYWINQTTPSPLNWQGLVAANPALARAITLRPIGNIASSDNPYFTGSNPNFDPVNGPWDVDNDGDGTMDSVWVDLGSPVRVTTDGRRYKPLFAILCIDLDGRLNVNAHGSLAQVDQLQSAIVWPGQQLNASDPSLPTGTPAGTVFGPFAGNPGPLNLPRGVGYGPADVNLAGLFSIATSMTPASAAATATGTDYANFFNSSLLMANGSPIWEGRYGDYGNTRPLPGVTGATNPWAASPLGAIKFFEYPPSGYPNLPNAFSSLPDLSANSVVTVDYGGMPLVLGVGGATDASLTAYGTQNNPYEFDLSRKVVRASAPAGGTKGDNPFTAVELERLLRYYDLDASQLPDRLRQLLNPEAVLNPGDPTKDTAALLRARATTESWDLPSPSIVGSVQSGASYFPIHHLLDLAMNRNSSLTNTQLAQLFPPEVVAGLRMDVNRPFGNGRDDPPGHGNGVVDEPGEAAGEMVLTDSILTGLTGGYSLSIPFSHTGGLAVTDVSGGAYNATKDELYARQLYARHLYVLMMMLKGPGQIAFDGKGPTASAETARGVAQWAVNVADFRDRDSIMTPFKYTTNPFSQGWTASPELTVAVNTAPNSDGDPSEGLVWGCERPELLLTETFAWHDRRTEDTNRDAGTHALTTDVPTPDPDFDQRLQPWSGFFVELYNPWTTLTSNVNNAGPAPSESAPEFYGAAGGAGVLLNQQAADGSGSPVWRLLIVKDRPTLDGEPKDPDFPNPSLPGVPLQPGDTSVERSVYFVNPTAVQSASGVPLATSFGQPYFPSSAIAPVLPGRHAVVGSSGPQLLAKAVTGGTSYTIPVGRNATDATAQGAVSDPQTGDGMPNLVATTTTTGTQRIVLTPSANPTVNQVQIFSDTATPVVPPPPPVSQPTAQTIQPIVAVPVDQCYDLATGKTVTRSLSISEPLAGYSITTGGWDPSKANGEGSYNPPLDHPLDAQGSNAAVLMINGTTPNFRTIHLQRLANPLVAWDPATNPYLTVDTLSVDLTAFNGVTKQPEMVGPGPKVAITTGTTNFSTLERGFRAAAAPPLNPPTNLWSHQPPNLAVPTNGPALGSLGSQVFSYLLRQTLGYLNSPFGTPMNSASVPTVQGANLASYTGAPQAPFPWLTWNNRPFTGAWELMLVPKSRSSRLLYDYTASANGTNAPLYVPYNAGPPASGFPFNHLLDFFDRTSGTNLYRAFEFLQVPSRFVGTETFFNPQSFLSDTNGFRPPFNKVSNYRDPGRVNINTVSDPVVWQGSMNTFSPTPDLPTIIASRTAGGSSPTVFNTPFRSGVAINNSPPNYPLTRPGAAALQEIDATLMRGANLTTPTTPLFDSTSAAPYNNSDQNPYFRFQTFDRLSNLVTTRSNVYAVWITVGYFEVTPWTGPGNPSTSPQVFAAPHLDGYQLGQELGSDTGDIKRHRAFFIFDRTIPVGFERGANHNVDRAILLQRFIE